MCKQTPKLHQQLNTYSKVSSNSDESVSGPSPLQPWHHDVDADAAAADEEGDEDAGDEDDVDDDDDPSMMTPSPRLPNAAADAQSHEARSTMAVRHHAHPLLLSSGKLVVHTQICASALINLRQLG